MENEQQQYENTLKQKINLMKFLIDPLQFEFDFIWPFVANQPFSYISIFSYD